MKWPIQTATLRDELISSSGDRQLCIVDYKTGAASADENLSPSHARQLGIYAWLMATAEATATVEAAVFSVRAASFQLTCPRPSGRP